MVAKPDKNRRLSPPLASVFRASHAAKDAKRKLDLRDGEGERVIAARRAAVRIAITEPVLRQNVTIDLDRLMNTVNFESSTDLTNCPFVQGSILNFGLPDIAHRTIDESGVELVVAEIKAALTTFEPRLSAASINVERDETLDKAELRVRFFIRADLVCDPIAVPITFVADLLSETGAFSISQR